jgi:hypothetical protein
MNNDTNLKALTVSFMLIFFFTTISSGCLAQSEKDEIKDFKIIIEKTDAGLKMKSSEGSAWIDLAFSLNKYKPQAIDEYGMTALDDVRDRKDKNLADFLFTVTIKDNTIALEGIDGTAWKTLEFNLDKNNKQAINQFGTTSLN